MKNFFFLLSLLFLVLSCKKDKTIWESDWTSPIVNDTISLNKFVNDSTLSITSSGFYELDLHRTLVDINLLSIVSIPDTTVVKTFHCPVNLLVGPNTQIPINPIGNITLDVEDIELKNIILSNGIIDIQLGNPYGTSVNFILKLPGVTKDGVVLEQLFVAPPGTMSNPGVINGSIDLTGYTADLTGPNGSSFNVLQINYSAKTAYGGVSVNVTTSDEVTAKATLRDVKVNYARGYFGNRIIANTTETIFEAFTKISGVIDLPETNLNLTISNGFKIPVKIKMNSISNENLNGNIVPLTVTAQNPFQFGEAFNVNPATGSWSTLQNSETNLSFNGLNSNLETYLENLGAKQKIGYEIQLNPWGNTSGGWNEIFPNSHLKLSIDASMPLHIGADGLTIRDTFDFDVKQNTEKTHVVSGALVLKAINAFPMSGEISLNLLDISGNVIYVVSSTDILQSSLYGSTVSLTGIQTCVSEIHFVLPENVLSKLESIKKVSINAEFNTPNIITNLNEPVLITEGAFLGVKLKGAFKLENRF